MILVAVNKVKDYELFREKGHDKCKNKNPQVANAVERRGVNLDVKILFFLMKKNIFATVMHNYA